MSEQIGKPGDKNNPPKDNENQPKEKAIDHPSVGSQIPPQINPTPPNTNNSSQKRERFCQKYKDELEFHVVVWLFGCFIFIQR